MNTFLKNLLITCLVLCAVPNITNAQFFTVGCKNPMACNFDPDAIIHIESLCDYGNFICPDPCDESTCPFVFDIPEILDIPEFDPVWCPWCPVCLTCPPLDLDSFVNPVINIGINLEIGGLKLGDTENSTLVNNSFKVFPNPTSGITTIVLDKDLSELYSFIVFDLIGNVIQQNTFTSKQTNLDLSDVAKGIYLIEIRSGEANNVLSTQKLLVK